jgi:hypothetical protein
MGAAAAGREVRNIEATIASASTSHENLFMLFPPLIWVSCEIPLLEEENKAT